MNNFFLLSLLLFVVPSRTHSCAHDQVSGHELHQGSLLYHNHPHALHSNNRVERVRASRNVHQLSHNPPVAVYKNMRIHLEYVESHFEKPDYLTYLKDNIMGPAVEWFNSSLQVIPATESLKISRRCSMRYAISGKCQNYESNPMCGGTDGVPIPPEHFQEAEVCLRSSNDCVRLPAGKGIAHADMVFYVSAANKPTCKSSSATLAFASACSQDQYDRPIAGYINFCPLFFDEADDGSKLSKNIHIAIHEMTHALGFSSTLFRYFRDPQGHPYMPRNDDGSISGPENGISAAVINSFEERGHTVFKLVTPNVLAAVRDHFECPSLNGAEIEGQADSTSHFEKRVFMDEMMTSSVSHPISSLMSLAVLADSGWYKVSYKAAQRYDWGYHQGCAVAMNKCLGEPKSQPVPQKGFCSRPGKGCTHARDGVGYCDIKEYEDALLADYQYFTSPTKGGSTAFADYCPVYARNPATLCANTSNAPKTQANVYGESYGSQSKCFASSLVMKGYRSTDVGAGCYRQSCVPLDTPGGGGVQIFVDGAWIKCPKAGPLRVEGFDGEIQCPAFEDVCRDRVATRLSDPMAPVFPEAHADFVNVPDQASPATALCSCLALVFALFASLLSACFR